MVADLLPASHTALQSIDQRRHHQHHQQQQQLMQRKQSVIVGGGDKCLMLSQTDCYYNRPARQPVTERETERERGQLIELAAIHTPSMHR